MDDNKTTGQDEIPKKVGRPKKPKGSRTDQDNYKIRRFIESYVRFPDGRQAVLEAGFHTINPDRKAYQLLSHPKIQAEIQIARDLRSRAVGMSQEEILREIWLLATSSIADYEIDVVGNRITTREGVNPERIRSVKSIRHKAFVKKNGDVEHEIDVQLWSKTESLAMASKILGMFDKNRHLEEKSKAHAQMSMLVLNILKILSDEQLKQLATIHGSGFLSASAIANDRNAEKGTRDPNVPSATS